MRYVLTLLLTLVVCTMSANTKPIITLVSDDYQGSGDLLPRWTLNVYMNIISERKTVVYIDYGSGKVRQQSLEKGENRIVHNWDMFLELENGEIELMPESIHRTVKIYGDAEDIGGFVCYDNNVSSLDISRLKNLKHLDISRNRLLTQIDLSPYKALEHFNNSQCSFKKLDISNNDSLIYLSCSSNDIKTLDLSNNLQLEALDCGNTKIGKLELSQNTELKYLRCPANNLKTLNLEKNNKLLALECHSNKLSELTLPYMGALEYLGCAINDLKTLDISTSPSLVTVDCAANKIENLILGATNKIEKLRANRNKLTDLDLSSCPALRILLLKRNKLTKLNIVANKKLQSLACTSNKLQILDISHNSELLELECSGNLMTELVTGTGKLEIVTSETNLLTKLDIRGYANMQQFMLTNKSVVVSEILMTSEQEKQIEIYHYTRFNGQSGYRKRGLSNNRTGWHYSIIWQNYQSDAEMDKLFGKSTIYFNSNDVS